LTAHALTAHALTAHALTARTSQGYRQGTSCECMCLVCEKAPEHRLSKCTLHR
jgi:hypothetical protein